MPKVQPALEARLGKEIRPTLGPSVPFLQGAPRTSLSSKGQVLGTSFGREIRPTLKVSSRRCARSMKCSVPDIFDFDVIVPIEEAP